MRVVIQRVVNSKLYIENKIHCSINKGLMILVGIEESDNDDDIDFLVSKIYKLRIFDDSSGVMNLSINEIEGDILLVSQFTLHASTKKGNRPSYIKAAKPDIAIPIYNKFICKLQSEINTKIQTGVFGAMMQIELINDGPVTIIIDSKNKE